jgi:hypothetical protein
VRYVIYMHILTSFTDIIAYLFGSLL